MPITAATPLEHLLAIANSYHEPEARDEGSGDSARWLPAHDHLENADTALEFLGRSGIRLNEPPSARHLAALREIREAARSLAGNRVVYEHRTQHLVDDAQFRLDAGGHLRPARGGWDGIVDGLLPPLVELRDHADRLKLCENDQCRWLFIDRSKNHSRQWCESGTCGNRARVRRFRAAIGTAR